MHTSILMEKREREHPGTLLANPGRSILVASLVDLSCILYNTYRDDNTIPTIHIALIHVFSIRYAAKEIGKEI